METFSALLALYEGNPPVTGGFHSQSQVTRSFDAFFDLLTIGSGKKSRLMAPSHYLNQCWRIIKVHYHQDEFDYTIATSATSHKDQLKNF